MNDFRIKESSMKKLNFVVFALLLCLLITGLSPVYAKQVTTVRIGKGMAKVSFLEGSASMLPVGKKGWRTLKVKDALQGGDEVSTGPKSHMELLLPDHSTVRFADNTRFKILQLTTVGDSKQNDFKIHVTIGRTWASVTKFMGVRKNRFEMSCNNAVTGVRGTVYRMNVNDDKSTLVRVYDGEVFVKGGGEQIQETQKSIGIPHKIAGPTKVEGPKKVSMEEWTVIIKSMQQIVIKGDGTADQPRDFTEEEDRDPWVDWNKERDKQGTGM